MPVEPAKQTSKAAHTSKATKGSKPVAVPKERPTGFPLNASSNFIFMAHPMRWDVFPVGNGEYEILPLLTKLEFQAGIAGVLPVKGKDLQDGDPSWALLAKQQSGWQAIPADTEVTAFGEKEVGYVHFVENDRGEYSHLSVWERPYMLGSSVFFDRDQDGYIQFLRHCKTNILPPMDQNVGKALQAKLKELASLAKNSATPRGKETAEEINARIEAIKKVSK